MLLFLLDNIFQTQRKISLIFSADKNIRIQNISHLDLRDGVFLEKTASSKIHSKKN
jgi:hypothetical protein